MERVCEERLSKNIFFIVFFRACVRLKVEDTQIQGEKPQFS